MQNPSRPPKRPSSASIIADTERVSARNYDPLPVALTRGAGIWVWDVEGRRYLDCISAYSSLNQGHCHPRVLAALEAQAARLSLTSRAVHNDRMGVFLERLTGIAGLDKALPMNTGAEAVETAIKLARKWGHERKRVADGAARIIVCRNNFHGRTTTIVGFSTEASYRDGFGPFTPGFDVVDFDDPEQLKRAIGPDTVGVLVEPIQAEAGIIVPSPGYLRALRRICREHGILLMLDEIQTGLGRTGRLFAHEHESEAEPDVLILGKALGGGLYPVSAVLASAEVMDVIGPGDHGSTFGGNPLASAVGLAALDVIVEEDLAARAESMGRRLRAGIEEIASARVRDVRGKGLLIGIEVDPAAGTARELALELLAQGVLAKDTHRYVLRLAPPLIVTEADIDWLLERIARVLA